MVKDQNKLQDTEEYKVNPILVKSLLACGVLSSIFYFIVNLVIHERYPGYDPSSQTVGELFAIGAPTRTLMVPLRQVYVLLVMGFGCGVMLKATKNRILLTMGGMIFIYAFVGLITPPMHRRELLASGGKTMTDNLHIAFTIMTLFMMVLTMGFGAGLFGTMFRLYSILSMIGIIIFGFMAARNGPRLEFGLPTPMAGVWDRTCIGLFLLWIAIISIRLLAIRPEATKKN